MTIARRTVLKGSLVGGLGATLAAPVVSRARAATSTSVLTTVMRNDLRSFDPIWTSALITGDYGVAVYDTLFSIDAKFRDQPQMVSRWSVSEDKRTYTFELRNGLLWQDGTPVTSADCVASIRRWAARNTGGQLMLQFTKDLSPKDDRTFVLTLTEPFGLVIRLLASPSTPACFMMRKRDAETDPFQQVTSHIGSGPFIFNETATRPGTHYVFDKFTKYVPRPEPASGFAGGKVVKIDRMIWDNIGDPQTAIAGIESGEIDFYELPPTDLLPRLAANPHIKFHTIDKTGFVGTLRMNCLYPPFDNVKARQAMLYLIDQGAVMKAAFGDPRYYRNVHSLFGAGTLMSNDANIGWSKIAPDPERSKTLFREAGYHGEPVIVLQPSDYPFVETACELVVGWLQSIGVNAQPAVSTWGGIISRRAVMAPPDKGGWNIFCTSVPTYDYSDPTTITLAANGKKGWFGWPSDAAYESLRRKWATSSDNAERLAIAKQMQALAWEFVPSVFLGQYVNPSALRENVHGLLSAPDSVPFWNIYKT